MASYGSPEWDKWILGEEEGLQHVKYALVFEVPVDSSDTERLHSYDAGIQTFDTASVDNHFRLLYRVMLIVPC